MTREMQIGSLLVIALCGCGRIEPVEEIRADSGVLGTGAAYEVTIDPVADWPWWRGPRHDGSSGDHDLTTEWSPEKNVHWVADVPGRGHSSPCVAGNRVFLTTADDDAQQQKILCFDRDSGDALWENLAHAGGFMASHKKNSHASATLACDGQRVFALFLNDGGLWATAVDLDGNLLWQKRAGPFGAEHGYGSSPVIFQSLLIVLGDNMSGSFIAALDRATGHVVWRTARPTTGRHGSYAAPIVARVAGREQLLVSGMSGVSSYDPRTGESLWSCEGPAEVTANTIASNEDLVFASGGYPEKELLAIRADGAGDVTDSHVVWRARKGVAYVPSPVYHDGRLYVISDNGIATCFDANSGKVLRTRRIGGNYSASPIVAGGHLYIPDEAGTTLVIKADESLELVARNELGNGGYASASICGNRIYLRTLQNLYCIGLNSELPSTP